MLCGNLPGYRYKESDLSQTRQIAVKLLKIGQSACFCCRAGSLRFSEINLPVFFESLPATIANHDVTIANHDVTFASHDVTFASHDATFASHDVTFASHDATFASHDATFE
jgi:hypothetical protein